MQCKCYANSVTPCDLGNTNKNILSKVFFPSLEPGSRKGQLSLNAMGMERSTINPR
jgi:hypothetical protein